jgi:hypothetical protein
MMTEKEKVMNETNWAMRKITDLRDMLDDGMPIAEYRSIARQIEDLEDVIFYNQEYLSTLN